MAILFQCPSCSHQIRFRLDQAGKAIRCTICGAKGVVPQVEVLENSDLERGQKRAATNEETKRSRSPSPNKRSWNLWWVLGYALLIGAGWMIIPEQRIMVEAREKQQELEQLRDAKIRKAAVELGIVDDFTAHSKPVAECYVFRGQKQPLLVPAGEFKAYSGYYELRNIRVSFDGSESVSIPDQGERWPAKIGRYDSPDKGLKNDRILEVEIPEALMEVLFQMPDGAKVTIKVTGDISYPKYVMKNTYDVKYAKVQGVIELTIVNAEKGKSITDLFHERDRPIPSQLSNTDGIRLVGGLVGILVGIVRLISFLFSLWKTRK